MARRWHIQGYDRGKVVFDAWASGRLSEGQVGQILARLMSRHLTDREVLEFALRSNDKHRVSELVRSTNEGLMTLLGGSDHYTAKYEVANG